MPVLVDGNNLMFAARNLDDPDRPVGRLLLAQTLGQWAEIRGHDVRIVYDGPAPPQPKRQQFEHPSLIVTYSGKGVSADSVLADLIAQSSAPRLLVVVSSDREVQRDARRRKATAVESAAFWSRVRAELARPQPDSVEPEEKHQGLDAPAVDEWMRIFGFDEDPPDPRI